MSNLLASYLEVINAAKVNQHFEDFKTGGRLAGDIRRGYQARMTAFSDLAKCGFVRLESGLLTLGALSQTDWLVEGLQNGDIQSWEICDAYPDKLRKFKPDLFNLEQIGKDGEDFVISLLHQNLEPSLHSEIFHVSLTDDTAGYDISFPSTKFPGRILLEVKTSTRFGDEFTFHLSRNEWRAALRNPNWFLVLVMKVQGEHSIFGTLDGQSLVSYYPEDNHQNFHWTSAIGKLSTDDVYAGLPGL